MPDLPTIVDEIASSCAAAHARARSRALTRDYDRALAETGLRSTELAVLIAVASLGAPRLHEVADRLGMERSTLTRSVQNLGGKGWLAVEREGHRKRFVRVTPAGERLIVQAYPAWRAAQDAATQLTAAQSAAAGSARGDAG